MVILCVWGGSFRPSENKRRHYNGMYAVWFCFMSEAGRRLGYMPFSDGLPSCLPPCRAFLFSAW